MTAPDLLALDKVLTRVQGGVECLKMIVDNLDASTNANAELFWLAGALERDLSVAFDWHDAAHKGAGEIGPRAVS